MVFIIKKLQDACAKPEVLPANNQIKIMSESNNVKILEVEKGKFMFKKYDETGSCIFRSEIFNSEAEAREQAGLSEKTSENKPAEEQENVNVPVAPETGTVQSTEENNAGVASADASQSNAGSVDM